jgi:hypothetical protein
MHPDILADTDSDTLVSPLVDKRGIGGLEVAFLIENVIGGQ